MATTLAEAFREKVSSSKDFRMKNETEYDVAYPTGFLAFDFLNGTVIHVRSNELDLSYNSVGIVDGSMVTVIGRSGCGKTTFIMQSAAEIIKPFPTACIYHDDIEGGIVQSRKEILMKMSSEEMVQKYIPRNSGITAENFFERIKMIHDLKLENRENYEYDTGLYSSNGKRIYKLEPTVYILDSLAMLMPEKYADEEELSGQMAATAAAKTNSSIFKRIIPMLKAANIILFVVNHITEKVELNMFAKTKAQVAYLKPGETLGGGRVAVYVTNLLIRLDDNSKLKEKEGLGIAGSIVEVSLLKSRTAAANSSINLVFDYKRGFDRELSLFYGMKEAGFIVGKGAYLEFKNNPEYGKFTQKTFKSKLNEDTNFQKLFTDHAGEYLKTLINNPETIIEEDSFDTTAAILGIA